MNQYETLQSTVTSKTPRHRPAGISILAIINVISGISVILFQILLSGVLQFFVHQLDFSTALLIISLLLVAALDLMSGAGLWLGKKWGWWTGAFVYVININRTARILIEMVSIAMTYTAVDSGFDINLYLIRYTIQALVQIMVLLYLFTGNVLKYFELEDLPKWKIMLMMAGAILFLISLNFIIEWPM